MSSRGSCLPTCGTTLLSIAQRSFKALMMQPSQASKARARRLSYLRLVERDSKRDTQTDRQTDTVRACDCVQAGLLVLKASQS